MTRLIRARAGQSTAEYAVLFAIVIGAAIAMQQFVKTRLQGAVKKVADEYQNNAQSSPFEPTRTSKSTSGTDITFDGAKSGAVKSLSGGNTTLNKSVD